MESCYLAHKKLMRVRTYYSSVRKIMMAVNMEKEVRDLMTELDLVMIDDEEDLMAKIDSFNRNNAKMDRVESLLDQMCEIIDNLSLLPFYENHKRYSQLQNMVDVLTLPGLSFHEICDILRNLIQIQSQIPKESVINEVN